MCVATSSLGPGAMLMFAPESTIAMFSVDSGMGSSSARLTVVGSFDMTRLFLMLGCGFGSTVIVVLGFGSRF